jgi:alkylation response protein AidB-like acyl-CoA dehydrogenase
MKSAEVGTPNAHPAAPTDLDDFRLRARRWLTEAAPTGPSDYGAIVPESEIEGAILWQRRLAEAGFAGLHWPRRWGGQGLTTGHTAIWLEECARAQVPPFLNMVGSVLTAEALMAFGTDEQRDEHLPPILTAGQIWCQLFSEPDAGSDLAHLSTRADRDGEGWVLRGQKVWCSNGHLADRGICLARTDPDAPAHRGLSFFLIDMHTPGVSHRPLRQITGRSDFDEVFFDDVQLPASALLGPAGGGWGVGMAILTNERNHVGALAISLGHRLDRLVAAGSDLSPAVRNRLIGLWARGQAIIQLGQQQRLGPASASLMKLAVAELSFETAGFFVQLAGAGALLESPVGTQLVASTAARIAGGTTEVQKTIIAERILGLPREPVVG